MCVSLFMEGIMPIVQASLASTLTGDFGVPVLMEDLCALTPRATVSKFLTCFCVGSTPQTCPPLPTYLVSIFLSF